MSENKCPKHIQSDILQGIEKMSSEPWIPLSFLVIASSKNDRRSVILDPHYLTSP